MTVRDLIEKLEAIEDGELPVVVKDDDGDWIDADDVDTSDYLVRRSDETYRIYPSHTRITAVLIS